MRIYIWTWRNSLNLRPFAHSAKPPFARMVVVVSLRASNCAGGGVVECGIMNYLLACWCHPPIGSVNDGPPRLSVGEYVLDVMNVNAIVNIVQCITF